MKHKLQWTTPPENLNYDPILVTLAEVGIEVSIFNLQISFLQLTEENFEGNAQGGGDNTPHTNEIKWSM